MVGWLGDRSIDIVVVVEFEMERYICDERGWSWVLLYIPAFKGISFISVRVKYGTARGLDLVLMGSLVVG